MEQAISFTFFASYYDALQYLSDSEFGEMIKAICEYALRGKEPELDNPVLKGYWTLIRPTLDLSIKRAEAGRRGGQSVSGASRNSNSENHAKNAPDVDDADESCGSSRFRPPKVEEVAAYCLERGNGIDAQHFIDFYESKGWKVGRTPMKSWKAAVRTWENRNGDKQPETPKDGTKLGVGEFIARDGSRRYGDGSLPAVPMDAPPRPDNDSVFSAETKSWIQPGI